MKNVIALFCAFISLIGCNTAPKVDTIAEADSIRNLEDQWLDAILAKDANKILSFYSTEAISMSPNKPIAIGLEAIRNGIESMLADTSLIFNTYSGNVDAIEVSATGWNCYLYPDSKLS